MTSARVAALMRRERADRVDAGRQGFILHALPYALGVQAALGALALWWMAKGAGAPLAAKWGGTLILALLFQLVVWLQAQRDTPGSTAANWRGFQRRLAVVMLIAALAWGAGIFFGAVPGPGVQLAILLALVASVATVTAVALSPSRLAFHAFLLPLAAVSGLPLLGPHSPELVVAVMLFIAFTLLLTALHSRLEPCLHALFRNAVENAADAREQRQVFDATPQAIGVIKPYFLARCNRHFAELFGSTIEQAVGRTAWSWHRSYAEWQTMARQAVRVLRQGQPYRTVAQLKRQDDSLFWCEITAMALDPTDLALGTVWVAADIGDKLHTEHRLKAREQELSGLLRLTSDWNWEMNDALQFSRVEGDPWTRRTDLRRLVLGKSLWQLPAIGGRGNAGWMAQRELMEARKPFRDFALQIELPGLGMRWFSLSGEPRLDASGRFIGYHGLGSDMTERVLAGERYRHEAYHDALTGLPNRRLLMDRLEQLISRLHRRPGNAALLMVDLDGFKTINDTQGHAMGDLALVTLAQRLRSCVRAADTVARLGGDEFVVLLQEAPQLHDVVIVAEKILRTVGTPIALNEHMHQCTPSIGIALCPEHAMDGERLLQLADAAMYQAKKDGGARFHIVSKAVTDTLPPQPATPARDAVIEESDGVSPGAMVAAAHGDAVPARGASATDAPRTGAAAQALAALARPRGTTRAAYRLDALRRSH